MIQEHETAYVNHINSVQSSWKAAVHDDESMKSVYSMWLSGGPAVARPQKLDLPSVRGPEILGDQTLMQIDNATETPKDTTVTAIQTEQDSNFPPSLDWRNFNGRNYLTSVKKQDDRANGYGCGSCYAVAVLGVLESRVRVASNLQHQPNLSIQDIVSCSPYAQGCDGGFPYLVGKHLEDFGVTETECMPYDLGSYYAVSPSISDYLLGDQTVCKQAARCGEYEKKKWYATNYHYVGGYYGACNEKDMIRELQNGPFTIGFWASQDLVYYHTGVWHHVSAPEITSHNGKREWEKTNHAVVLVGYGEQAGERYWIAKNSWGPSWGDDGYFKIRRGTDEGGFESMASVIDPVLPSSAAAVNNIQTSSAKSTVSATTPKVQTTTVGKPAPNAMIETAAVTPNLAQSASL
jgi:cathepsin C